MPRTPQVFRGSQAVAKGAVTSAQLRSPRYTRLFRDTYTPRETPLTHELRCRAAALVVPRHSVITASSAATLRGVPLASAEDPVELLVPPPHQTQSVDGLLVSRARTARAESTAWRGIRVAKPTRLVFDLLRSDPLPEAVARGDACLRQGLTTVDELRAFLDPLHDHGVRQARRALELLDARTRSIPESELRVLLSLAGLEPAPQLEIRENGRFVAQVELGFEAERVAVEHDDGLRGPSSQERLNRLHRAGWQVVRVTTTMRHCTRVGLVAEVRHALAEANRSRRGRSRPGS